MKYAIRMPANDSLERDTAELLTRPVGRPGQKPVVWYKDFLYHAASWKTARGRLSTAMQIVARWPISTGAAPCAIPHRLAARVRSIPMLKALAHPRSHC